jgi:small subunit ribosomal protein S20
MPNIKSAIKRVKQNDKRRALNASQKSALRTSIKAVETAIANKDAQTAQSALQLAEKKLDKAAGKGLIHKNAASRKKSRLTLAVNSLNA